MKTMIKAIKLYYSNMPKWLLPYNFLIELLSSVSIICNGVILPSVITRYFTGEIDFGIVLIAISFNLLLTFLVIISSHVVGNRMLPKEEIRLKGVVQRNIFKKMHEVSMENYDRPEFFDQFQLAMDNTEEAAKASAEWLNSFWGMMIRIVTTTIVVTLVNAKLLLVMLGCLILGVILEIFISVVGIKLKEKSARIANVFDYCERVFYVRDYAIETRISSISKAILGLYDHNLDAAKKVIKDTYKVILPVDVFRAAIPEVVTYFGLLGYVCYGIVVRHAYSAGDMVMLLTGALTLYYTLSMISSHLSRIVDHSRKFQFYLNFMNVEGQTEETEPFSEKDFSLKIEDLTMEFDGRVVVDHFSLTMEQGSSLAIVGPNGAGKSTLLKALLRYYKPTEGCVYVGGREASTISEKEYRHLFAYMGQEPVVMEASILENILMKSTITEEDRKCAWGLLEQVGLKDKVASLENSIDSVIGKEFSEDGVLLSGGEMQKLALARVLAMQKPIVILDEPSSHMDPKAEKELFECLKYAGKTLIFITHHIKNAQYADRVIWLENGAICESGTFDQLLKANGKFRMAYDSKYNVLLGD